MDDCTPCIRCGTKRIVSKTWKEKVNNSTIICTQTVCPNPECQKKVDQELKKKSDIQKARIKKSLEQRKNNRRGKSLKI